VATFLAFTDIFLGFFLGFDDTAAAVA